MGGLSVGDGFKFGCGFILAGLVFYLILLAVSAVLALLMTVLGLMPLLLQPQTMLPGLPLI